MHGTRGLTSPPALMCGLALGWRRRRPIAVLATVIAGSAPVLLYDAAPVRHDSVSTQLAGLFALYAAGAYTTGRARAWRLPSPSCSTHSSARAIVRLKRAVCANCAETIRVEDGI